MTPIAGACAADGKTTLYPRVVAEGRPLEFAVADGARLAPGAYGIPEPPADAPAVALASIDLLFVPGVAFDSRGARLGSGKGYYDRTIELLRPEEPRPVTVGVAYDFQIIPEVPERAGDRRVDYVITERRLVTASG